MKLKDLEEIAELLSEGVLVDRIVGMRTDIGGEGWRLSLQFSEDIKTGRFIVQTSKFPSNCNGLQCLRRYNWFLQWISSKYGDRKVSSKEEAENFIEQKLREIKSPTSFFWDWLRRETLKETSKLMECGN